jgi:stage IV sporulation protein FB
MNFTFLNIPVQIQPTFWIFLLFLTEFHLDPSIESLIVGGVMIVSLLLHEYGHALTAVYFGAKPSITLEAFGGRAEYRNVEISRKQAVIITLNGPLFESLLIFLPYFLLESGIFASYHYLDYTLYVTMRLNILWCLLNLIPIDPLDGGHIMRYLLENKFGDKGYKISLIVGLICAALIAPYLYFTGQTFFSIFLVILGIQTYLKLKQNLAQNNVSSFSLFMTGVDAANSNNLDQAKKNFIKLLKSKDNQIKHSAIESLAKIYYTENNSKESYKLLLNADHQFLQEGKSLLCKLAFERKNYPLVIKYSMDIYNLDPSFETAILNSQAYAYMNHPGLAGGWLKTASQFGIEYNDRVRELLKLAPYDAMRNHEAFKEVLTVLDPPKDLYPLIEERQL